MSKNQKKVYLIIAFIILLIGLSIVYAFRISDINKYSKNLPEINQTIITNFLTKKAYDTVLSSPTEKIEGKFVNPSLFEGDHQIGSKAESGNMSYTKDYSIIKVDNENFIKKDGEESYKKNEDSSVSYILNMITHPDWIQIQKRLADQKIDGVTYLQYEIFFEKPDQEIVKTMSQEQLENLRIYGTILVKKDNFQLKQIKLHQGKNTETTFLIEYSPLENAPVIEKPKI